MISTRSFVHLFATNGKDTFARCEKYSSKLDIVSLAYSYLSSINQR